MTSIPKRRVVITGLGAVTNVGTDVPSMWRSVVEGRCGIGPITAFEQDEQWTARIAGEIHDWDRAQRINVREAKRMDRFCMFGVYAAAEAADDCGIDFNAGDPYRRGVVIGSGIGGILTIEHGHTKLLKTGPRKVSPFTVPKLMVNACAGNVSIRFDLRGVNSATATACATGGHAIGTAYYLIQRGDGDVMLAGGAEASITPLCIASFASMKALSTRNHEPEKASRPFDRDRDGFVLGEGAAVVVLEELDHAKARGARIYAEMVGFGSTGDAGHIAAPDPEGVGAMRAMKAALSDAGLNLDEVDYINAHGTSTQLGDAAEVYAVKALFGDHASKIVMSSTKSMTGHMLGAAGGLESVVSILAVNRGVIPPTINLDHPDDGFDLDFAAHTAQERHVRCALNNSFGFGGHNVSLAFKEYDGA
ncbi:MAG: beta-ketoacyl-ACP synthase II [Planctomycetes bacterium]|nr:beta-ketoacyl-ACP synthase II [Planctomycetota bacterium]MCH8212149.1 beta-ketoacyl-ACP synthase II [Planctomycetota bacterium]MCH8259475.1 beta-ketoacyl-ACP synthase II [Planctomycetota bacterium]